MTSPHISAAKSLAEQAAAAKDKLAAAAAPEPGEADVYDQADGGAHPMR